MRATDKARNLGFAVGLGVILIGMMLIGLMWIGLPQEAQAAPLLQDGTRGTLTVTVLSRSGVADTLYTADGDGHKFSNNGKVFVEVANAYTATITATFVTPVTVDGLDVEDLSVAIANGSTYFIGPFPPSQYNQQSGTDSGYVYLNFNDTVTGTVANNVTVAGFRIP
jgi:hypothetical protein